ncbi:MAG: transposase [Pseudomonadales bacterium RIFCSPLOWO2_12_59_9]|nr:MAG: transposase [Pseudomonadales bacterium RIFCSPLOWO2_12_59_9]
MNVAIALWNTVYLERATQVLTHAGNSVNPDMYQYPSSLGWKHVILTGDYVWRQSRKLKNGKFRPLGQVGNFSVRFFRIL